jgi:hypothetical protein
MPHSRAPFVTYDSTLLEHVSVGAASAAAWTSIRIASVLFLTALTAAAAQVSVQVPFTPVPFTLQPMVVLVGSARHFIFFSARPVHRSLRRRLCFRKGPHA